MQLLKRLFLLTPFFLSCSLTHAQNELDSSDFKIKNSTAYIAEFFTTNSERQEYFFQPLGLIINSTAAQFKTHHNFRIDAMLSYGAEPTAHITRDLQTFSNIEAGFLFGFFQFCYQYAKNNFWLKVGHQDINSDFLIPDYGLSFSRSSFGIDPVATINMPAPTYPVSAMSVTSQIRFNNQYTLRLGVFDGQFEGPNGDFLGLKTRLDKDEGYLFWVENQLSIFQNR